MEEEKKRYLKPRTIARIAGLQKVYTDVYYKDIASGSQDIVTNPDFIKEIFGDGYDISQGIDKNFFDNLTQNILANFSNIEKKFLPFCKKENITSGSSDLINVILAFGTFEILDTSEKLHPNIVISEYVKIAKFFFAKEEVSFINAILDSVYKSINQDVN